MLLLLRQTPVCFDSRPLWPITNMPLCDELASELEDMGHTSTGGTSKRQLVYMLQTEGIACRHCATSCGNRTAQTHVAGLTISGMCCSAEQWYCAVAKRAHS